MTKPASQQLDYTELSQELAGLLARLEAGELGIDEAVQHYARGLEIIALLEKQLLRAENQVTTLKATYDETEVLEEE